MEHCDLSLLSMLLLIHVFTAVIQTQMDNLYKCLKVEEVVFETV